MAHDTGWFDPAPSISVSQSADGGNTSWSGVLNSIKEGIEGADINCAPGDFNGNKISYRIHCPFIYTLPTNASIVGIEVRIRKKANVEVSGFTYCTDNVVQLSRLTTGGGDNKADGDLSTTYGYMTYGGSTDDWGAGLVANDFRQGYVGVLLKILLHNTTGSATDPIAYIDHVQMRVYYTARETITNTGNSRLIKINKLTKNGNARLVKQTTRLGNAKLVYVTKRTNSGNARLTSIRRRFGHNINDPGFENRTVDGEQRWQLSGGAAFSTADKHPTESGIETFTYADGTDLDNKSDFGTTSPLASVSDFTADGRYTFKVYSNKAKLERTDAGAFTNYPKILFKSHSHTFTDYVELKIKPEGTDFRINMYFADDNAVLTNYAAIDFNDFGKIRAYHLGTGWIDLQDYVAGTEYTVQVIFVTSTTFDVKVGSTTYNRGGAHYTLIGTMANIGSIWLQPSSGLGYIEFDDIKPSWLYTVSGTYSVKLNGGEVKQNIGDFSHGGFRCSEVSFWAKGSGAIIWELSYVTGSPFDSDAIFLTGDWTKYTIIPTAPDKQIYYINITEFFGSDNYVDDFDLVSFLDENPLFLGNARLVHQTSKTGNAKLHKINNITKTGNAKLVFVRKVSGGSIPDYDWHTISTFNPAVQDTLGVWSKDNWLTDVAEVESITNPEYDGRASHKLRLEYSMTDNNQEISLTFPTGKTITGTTDIEFDWKNDAALQYQHFFRIYNNSGVMVDEIDYASDGSNEGFSLMVIQSGGGSWWNLTFTPTLDIQQNKWYRITYRVLDTVQHMMIVYDYDTGVTHTSNIANNSWWGPALIDSIKRVGFGRQSITPLKYSAADFETSWNSGILHAGEGLDGNAKLAFVRQITKIGNSRLVKEIQITKLGNSTLGTWKDTTLSGNSRLILEQQNTLNGDVRITKSTPITLVGNSNLFGEGWGVLSGNARLFKVFKLTGNAGLYFRRKLLIDGVDYSSKVVNTRWTDPLDEEPEAVLQIREIDPTNTDVLINNEVEIWEHNQLKHYGVIRRITYVDNNSAKVTSKGWITTLKDRKLYNSGTYTKTWDATRTNTIMTDVIAAQSTLSSGTLYNNGTNFNFKNENETLYDSVKKLVKWGLGDFEVVKT